MGAVLLDFEKHRLHAMQREGSALLWFVLADVCEILGIEKSRQVAERLDANQKGACTIGTPGGPQEMLIVSEYAVYKIALTSRKPIAKRFESWLFGEVLPEIRRTGSYQGGSAPLDALIGSVQLGLTLPPSAEVIPIKRPTQAELDVDANRKHLDAITGVGQSPDYAGTWSGDVIDNLEPENVFIGERNPPAFWGEPLTKCRAHRFIDQQGHAWISRRYLGKAGELAEVWVCSEHVRSTRMREVFLSDDNRNVLLRFETMPPLIASQLLTRECGLSSNLIHEILAYLINNR